MNELLPYIDEILKEYLLFRGFFTTIQSFENDLKNDKFKSFSAKHIKNQLFHFISTFNAPALLNFWDALDENIFSNLNLQFAPFVNKITASLKKLYLVNSINKGHPEKVVEFFDLLKQTNNELLLEPEWEKWYALPYIKNPALDPKFSTYFTKRWVENFSISLHNFLNSAFYSLPKPRVLLFHLERQTRLKQSAEIEELKEKLNSVQKENSTLKAKLSNLQENQKKESNKKDTSFIATKKDPAFTSNESPNSTTNSLRNFGQKKTKANQKENYIFELTERE